MQFEVSHHGAPPRVFLFEVSLHGTAPRELFSIVINKIIQTQKLTVTILNMKTILLWTIATVATARDPTGETRENFDSCWSEGFVDGLA